MKTWEETWTAERLYDEDGPDVWCVLGEYQKYLCARSTEAGPLTEERARFISAAPDMARALLAIEWLGSPYAPGLSCPSCDEVRTDASLSAPHRPDCALDAALRKAGVR